PGAPGRGAAERMDHVALALAGDADQHPGIAEHHRRVVAGKIERHEFAAGGGDIRYQPSGARRDNGAVAGGGEDARQTDGADIGGAGVEAWDDYEYGDWFGRGL